jgi:hypothetical protein
MNGSCESPELSISLIKKIVRLCENLEGRDEEIISTVQHSQRRCLAEHTSSKRAKNYEKIGYPITNRPKGTYLLFNIDILSPTNDSQSVNKNRRSSAKTPELERTFFVAS